MTDSPRGLTSSAVRIHSMFLCVSVSASAIAAASASPSSEPEDAIRLVAALLQRCFLSRGVCSGPRPQLHCKHSYLSPAAASWFRLRAGVDSATGTHRFAARLSGVGCLRLVSAPHRNRRRCCEWYTSSGCGTLAASPNGVLRRGRR